MLSDERLEEHISRQPGVRYGAGCRDVATPVAQDDIALASGLLCRQVAQRARTPLRRCGKAPTSDALRTIEIPIAPVLRYECDGWVSCWMKLSSTGQQGTGSGTTQRDGGILIGYFDVPRKCVYVVDALPAPSDSVQHNQAFVRGYSGLPEKVSMIESRSGGQVGYIGEWHSHPDGASVGMSPDDATLLATIAEEVRADGGPA